MTEIEPMPKHSHLPEVMELVETPLDLVWADALQDGYTSTPAPQFGAPQAENLVEYVLKRSEKYGLEINGNSKDEKTIAFRSIVALANAVRSQHVSLRNQTQQTEGESA